MGRRTAFPNPHHPRHPDAFAANVNGTNPLLSGTLSWNANGSLYTRNVSYNGQADNCTYSHDDLGWLYTASCSAWSQTFSYDPFGNITKSGNGQWQPGYDQSSNRMIGYSYDNNGNPTSDGVHSYSWDSRWGNPTAIDAVSLTYDALGRMVEQSGGTGGTTQIVYGPTGAKLAVDLEEQGDLRGAIAWLKRAVAKDEGDAFLRLARIYLGQRRGASTAVELLRKAVSLDRDHISDEAREEAELMLGHLVGAR